MLNLIQKLLVVFALTHIELLTGTDARRLERNSLRHENALVAEQNYIRRSLDNEDETASETDQREYELRSYIKFWY